MREWERKDERKELYIWIYACTREKEISNGWLVICKWRHHESASPSLATQRTYNKKKFFVFYILWLSLTFPISRERSIVELNIPFEYFDSIFHPFIQRGVIYLFRAFNPFKRRTSKCKHDLFSVIKLSFVTRIHALSTIGHCTKFEDGNWNENCPIASIKIDYTINWHRLGVH